MTYGFMSNFTPGPWKAVPELLLDGTRSVAGRMPKVVKNKRTIAQVYRRMDARIKDGRCEEGEANAMLISAAPDLYKALELMCDAWNAKSEKKIQRAWKSASAALAKARGES